MALKYTKKQTCLRAGRIVPNFLWGILEDLETRISNVAAGTVEAGSISSDELANGAVTEPKLGTGAVTSGKMADGSVSAAKLRGDIKSFDSAGVTIETLTAAIADPATLPDGYTAQVKDTSDSNKIKLVTVRSGAFLVGAAFTAAV